MRGELVIATLLALHIGGCKRDTDKSDRKAPPGPAQGRVIEQLELAGDSYACARRAGGEVWCTGRKGEAPSKIANISDADDIALSPDHACALRKGGRVSCWGNVQAPDHAPDVAVEVEGLSDAKAIAVGFALSCALRATREVRCWRNASLFGAAEPMIAGGAVAGFSGSTAIAARGSEVCSIVEAGRVLCKGFTGRNRPPEAVPAVLDATAIAMGDDFSCALVRETVLCWGEGVGGLTPAPIPDFGSAKKLRAGPRALCVDLDDGTTRCQAMTRGQMHRRWDMPRSARLFAQGADGFCTVTTDERVRCEGPIPKVVEQL